MENGTGGCAQTGEHDRVESPVRSVATGTHGPSMALPGPFDILGYMSGPIMVESAEEHEVRHSHVVALPEEDGTERRAW